MRIDCETTHSPELVAAVRDGLRRHAEQHVGWNEYADLAMVARDGNGTLAGAALGETGRGWLHISMVWVDERFRRQRLGARLLEAIEQEAVRRGCRGVYLDTFSYQARPFYEKFGYEVFGTLDDYPPGHKRFFLCKRLGQA
ncbi:MAG TPA: GNAT family N-acetyltransferase [Tepidisphaeraceae bacterium]|jgi:GNAT superfamily N-acetyltransferase